MFSVLGGHFSSQVDPEELFRQIFGDFGRMGGGGGSAFEFEDSKYGHSTTSEVCFINILYTYRGRYTVRTLLFEIARGEFSKYSKHFTSAAKFVFIE